ncbi:MAG: anthranilate phosphoribosyltransferase, partial [Gammaproteobacteria bacterium WSBS_2016_MAG_OTU1]
MTSMINPAILRPIYYAISQKNSKEFHTKDSILRDIITAMSEIIYKELLAELLSRRNLSAGQMESAILAILQGVWTPAQTAGFLIAIKIKGETPEELAAAATAMRQMMTPASINDEQLVDTCGTGGDGAKLFNISTAAAFVAAAAGVRIAKHGNRAVSGSSGSSDVLAELGMPLDLSPDKIAECIRQTGIGFMFAPNHHPAMRHAAPVRKELGVRTMFNLLGPMTNPAGARRQVVGVYDPQLLTPYAETLTAIGTIRALVV